MIEIQLADPVGWHFLKLCENASLTILEMLVNAAQHCIFFHGDS